MRFIRSFTLLCCTLISMVPGAGALAAITANGGSALVVSLNAAEDMPGAVVFQLTNHSGHELSVLKWNTPLEQSLSSDVFRFSMGHLISYSGRHVKRAAPTASDFLLLPAGSSVSAEVILADYYEIAVAHRYAVSYSGAVSYAKQSQPGRRVTDVEQLYSQQLDSSAVEVELSASLPIGRARAPNYTSCSTMQSAQIDVAFEAAEQIALEARDALDFLPLASRNSSPRYNHWFGQYSAARYQTVRATYGNAASVMENEQVVFNCGCSDALYAFVYPSRPYEIYLCRIFWSASVTGTDSQAGTILHELTHFPQIRGTQDNAYGHMKAEELAQLNPDLAVSNADSYEYFAENTPAIAMQGEITPPSGDDSTPTFLSLVSGVALSGAVAEGGRVLYSVANAFYVELESISGDADLQVYSDSQLQNLLCSGTLAAANEVCEVGFNQHLYVVVTGYSAASYRVLARADNTPAAVVSLAAGNVIDGQLESGATRAYYVTGAIERIELINSIGSADLTVARDLSNEDGSVICQLSNANHDQCGLAGITTPVYAIVSATENSSYELRAIAAVGPTVTTQTSSAPSSGGSGSFFAPLIGMTLWFRQRRGLAAVSVKG